MADDLRCLSLHQPWASAMAEGLKAIETRSWATRYRGWVAIHAAKKEAALHYFGWLEEHHGEPEPLLEPFPHQTDITESGLVKTIHDLPLGAVVAVCRLADVVTTDHVGELPGWLNAGPWVSAQEADWGDYSPGRYAWLFDIGRTLPEPIPARGRQGLWKPDENLRAQLLEVTDG